jgi:hypothetical protein
MAFTHLPPQAYTRDVLAAAYEWLRSQPQSIRELATSSDNLVSLYMQSRRRPGSLSQMTNAELTSLQTPANPVMNTASAEAFKKDLRSLAEGLKQFEEFPETQTAPSALTPAAPINPPVVAPSPTTLAQAVMPPAPPKAPQAPTPVSMPPPMPTTTAPLNSWGLDQRSVDNLKQVQQMLNLSTEREALRMLIAIGYDKIKDLLPKS